MADRKQRNDDVVWAINDHDTVVKVDKADFERRYKPAGYRLLAGDEIAPVQQHEFARYGIDSTQVFNPHEVIFDQRKQTARPDPQDD